MLIVLLLLCDIAFACVVLDFVVCVGLRGCYLLWVCCCDFAVVVL